MPTLEVKPKRYKVRRPARARATRTTANRPRRKNAALPGWGELAGENERVRKKGRATGALEHVSTARFALLVLAVAAAFTLYVGHVHATQDLLAEVQRMRRDNLRLHMQHDRLQGEYDRMTGPAAIYDRARALGLEEDITYAPTITLDD